MPGKRGNKRNSKSNPDTISGTKRHKKSPKKPPKDPEMELNSSSESDWEADKISSIEKTTKVNNSDTTPPSGSRFANDFYKKILNTNVQRKTVVDNLRFANSTQDTSPTRFKHDLELHFTGEGLHKYLDGLKLKKELDRCKPNAKIENAYVSRFNFTLKITAASELDVETLKSDWPNDAFENGLKLKTKNKRYFIIIKGVDTSIDTKDFEFNSELKRQNILNPIRLTYKKSPSFNIKAECYNLQAFNLALSNGVRIGYLSHKCEEFIFKERLQQCFKCQKLGHDAKNCKSELQICMLCSENHRFESCPDIKDKSKYKCANCNGNHPSCSRKCSIIENHSKTNNHVNNNKYLEITKKNLQNENNNPYGNSKKILNKPIDPLYKADSSNTNDSIKQILTNIIAILKIIVETHATKADSNLSLIFNQIDLLQNAITNSKTENLKPVRK